MNKKILIIGIVIAVVIIAIIGIILTTSKDYKYFLQVGDYEKAYSKAKNEEEKQIVIEQNSIDYMNRSVMKKADVLADQMRIEKGWYNKENNYFLLAYRDIDNNLIYEYFVYNTENKSYNISCSALNEVTIDKIEIADKSITEKMKSSVKSNGYSSAVADLGEYTLKKMLVEALNDIMKNENVINNNSIINANHFIEVKDFQDIPLLIANQ